MIGCVTMKQSALRARLQSEQAKPKNRIPGGKTVVERMFDACGDDAEEVKRILLSANPSERLSPEIIERTLKAEGVPVVASSAQIRRWVRENS